MNANQNCSWRSIHDFGAMNQIFMLAVVGVFAAYAVVTAGHDKRLTKQFSQRAEFQRDCKVDIALFAAVV